MELPGQIDWLQSFALRGELALSEQLARLLIANSTSNIFNGFLSTELSSLDLPQVAAKAVRLQQAATLFQLAGKEIEADRFLSSAAETLSYLTTGIRLQQSGLQTVLPNRMPKSVNPSGDEDDGIHIGLQGELLLAAATGKPKTGTKSLPGKFGKTLEIFMKRQKLPRLVTWKSKRIGRPYCGSFMQFSLQLGRTTAQSFNHWQPEEFIDLLVNLNYLKEAGVAAEWFLRFQPTNDRLLALLGDLFNRNDQPERAAKSLSLAVSINPNKPENRRLLAKLHETNGQFQNALEEWKRIIELEDDPKPEDLINMARAAFKAEKYSETIDICKSIAEEDPFNGLACSYWDRLLLQVVIMQLLQSKCRNLYYSRLTTVKSG
jgi:tetratricopeptide (TPR) repeat protein